MSISALNVNDTLLPKTPIFGNATIEPVYIIKKGPKEVKIKDVVTGQVDTVTEEQLKQNFTRMTEEAIAEGSGVDLTPEDIEDFKKNTETITDTLEDVTALNDTAKAVEEADTKGSFRDRLKNKKCNI
jgi:Zn finger protein HypA/HybF involved in hydrogenase expression